MRHLTSKEIEYILDFIVPAPHLPPRIGKCIAENMKERIRVQLVTQKVVPSIIPELKEQIRKSYISCLIHAGENVGVMCAQSIGEKQTQMTLNSVDWEEKLLVVINGRARVVAIGEWIDSLLEENPESIKMIPKNRTEFLAFSDSHPPVFVPSCDHKGVTDWHRVEGVTRHLPVGKLVLVHTKKGRSVTATQSKSFLVWDKESREFKATPGSDVKVGDYLPTTRHLSIPLGHKSKIPDRYQTRSAGYILGTALCKGRVLNTTGLSAMCFYPEVAEKLTQAGKDIGVSIDFQVNSYSITNPLFIRSMFPSRTLTKLPEHVYTAPREFIVGVLDGFFEQIYNVNAHRKSYQNTVRSPYKQLLQGLSFILTYFGILGVIEKNIGAPDYVLTIERDLPGFDVHHDMVIRIEKTEPTREYVYDLTVADTKNFQLWNGLNVRDTFHKAGQSEKGMTTGVPRVKELLEASQKPKLVSCKLYFKEDHELEDLRETVGHSVVGFTLKDLVKDRWEIHLDKTPEPWYPAYMALHDVELPGRSCVVAHVDLNKIYTFRLRLQDIADTLHGLYDDVVCICSPPGLGRLDIYVDTENINLPEDRLLFVDTENAPRIYMEECVQPALEKLLVCGIEGVTEIYYLREGEEWTAETSGSNYPAIMALDHVDETRTVSNNVWDIYESLGIEAVRQFLIDEFTDLMDGINSCHTQLLGDRMTWSGTVTAISRFTLNKENVGPFSKASFEEALDNFINAAARGDVEPTLGVSSSIICGKRARIGTGMIGLEMDLDALPEEEEESEWEDSQEEEEGESSSSDDDHVPDFVEI